MQQPAPDTFDSPYRGLQSESGGLADILEVIESVFARLAQAEVDALVAKIN